jgi:hypothetical protein
MRRSRGSTPGMVGADVALQDAVGVRGGQGRELPPQLRVLLPQHRLGRRFAAHTRLFAVLWIVMSRAGCMAHVIVCCMPHVA